MICTECLGYFPDDDAFQEHKCPLDSHEVINSLLDRVHELEGMLEEMLEGKEQSR